MLERLTFDVVPLLTLELELRLAVLYLDVVLLFATLDLLEVLL